MTNKCNTHDFGLNVELDLGALAIKDNGWNLRSWV